MNSAKCCQNNPRNAQAAAVLFENCRPFIAKELELLQPDIIVSQGDHAMKAVAEGLSEPAPRLRGSCAIRIIRCGGRPALWIATYHPTARAALYKNQLKTCRRAYVDAVKRFINGKRRTSRRMRSELRRVSDQLVRLVQVFFALVLAQSLVLFRPLFLHPWTQNTGSPY